MSKTEGNLYVIARKGEDGTASTDGERLVRAYRESTALKHVANDTLLARKATVEDALRLGAAKVAEENALGEEKASA